MTIVSAQKRFHDQKNCLGSLIIPFLPEKDRESLYQTSKKWRIANLYFEAKAHHTLQWGCSNSSLYLTSNKGDLSQVELLDILGKGGSKKAYQVGKGKALLLPNMDQDSSLEIARRWKRIVHEEIAMSQLLSKLGMLSPGSQRVSLSFSPNSVERIPAIMSESFRNLNAKRGWFIIDKKNPDNCTWRLNENCMFKSDEERLNPKNWDSIVDSLLTDVAHICNFGIPCEEDALNFAFVWKPCPLTVSQYEFRYFGFDFSDKQAWLSIPKIDQVACVRPDVEKVNRILNIMLDNLCFYEFGSRYDDKERGGKLKAFKDDLVKKYIPEVIARMQRPIELVSLDIEDPIPEMQDLLLPPAIVKKIDIHADLKVSDVFPCLQGAYNDLVKRAADSKELTGILSKLRKNLTTEPKYSSYLEQIFNTVKTNPEKTTFFKIIEAEIDIEQCSNFLEALLPGSTVFTNPVRGFRIDM